MELLSVRKEKLQFNRLAEFHVFVEFPISGYNAIWTNFCTFFFFSAMKKVIVIYDIRNEVLMTPLIFNIRPFEPLLAKPL